MGYTAECDQCGTRVENPLLMAQFHEDEYLTTQFGDMLKESGYDLQDTITFCPDCTLDLLL